MKKYIIRILIFIAIIGIFSPVFAATEYILLEQLPTMGETFNPEQTGAFGVYLNAIIKTVIGISAVLAVVMIVMGGIEYMGSELISSKESGKEKIQNALLGLLIAMGAWALLFTINPDLINSDVTIPKAAVVVDLGGENTTVPFEPINKTTLTSLGITCSGNNLSAIASSFIGRSNYSQTARNTTSGGKVNIDCSSYVSQVYNCAGLGNPGGTTAGIFGSERVPVTSISVDGTMVNGTALRVGDLLGWRQGENKEKNGHVVMYIGNGQVIDAQGSGVATRSLNSEQFKGRIKYIKKISAGATGS